MINKAPNQGLGPQNQQWRQWVENGVRGLDRRLEDKYGNDIANSLSAIQSSLRLVTSRLPEATFDSSTLFVTAPPVSLPIAWRPERFATLDISHRTTGWAAVTVSCQVYIENNAPNAVYGAIGFSSEGNDPNMDVDGLPRDRVLTPIVLSGGYPFASPFSFTGLFNFEPGETQQVSMRVGYVDAGGSTTERNFNFRDFFLSFTPVAGPEA